MQVSLDDNQKAIFKEKQMEDWTKFRYCNSCGSPLAGGWTSCTTCSRKAAEKQRAEDKAAAARQQAKRADAARRQEKARLTKAAKRKKQPTKPLKSPSVASQTKWSWIAAILGAILGAAVTVMLSPELKETYAPLIFGGMSSLFVGRFWRGILLTCVLAVSALVAINVFNQQ